MRLVFIGILCLTGFRLAAKETSKLFEFTAPKAANQAQSRPIKGTIGEAFIAVDLNAVYEDPATFQLVLLDGVAYIAERTRSVLRADGRFAWHGRLFFADRRVAVAAGFISFSVLNGQVSGALHAGAARYVISPAGPDLQRLVQVEPGGPICGLAGGLAGESFHESLSRKGGGASQLGGGPLVIDVMGLYTSDFTSSPGTEASVQLYIANSVDMANQAFANSKNNIQYNLVHMGPISATLAELGDIFPIPLPTDPELHPVVIAREWMNEEPAELVSKRNRYGADLVALFIPMQPTFPCGVANMPRLVSGQEVIRRIFPEGVDEPFNQRAYMAEAVDCGLADFTYAHEHGHNYGMDHDPATLVLPFGIGLIHRFARGHVFDVPDGKGGTDTVATVMGCAPGGILVPGQIACIRIPHFSNPNIDYEGVPTGVPDTPSVRGRENARVADLRAPMYAAFRPSGGDAPPMISITAPPNGATVLLGQNVALTAVATDAEDGNLTQAIVWDSDLEPIAGTGSPVNAQFSIPGQHLVSASVSDSAGSTVTATIELNVIDPANQPDIRVAIAATGVEIARNGTYTFPDTLVGDLPISTLFEIHNDGTGDLVIQKPGSLVSGAGFTLIGDPPQTPIPSGASASFRVRFQVATGGVYTGSVSIQSNDPDENPYTFTLKATAPVVKFIASYIPSEGAARTTFTSQSANPPSFNYFFDPSLGVFEERPGGACHIGNDNPTYLKVKLDSNVTIDSCNFQASWDPSPIQCNASVLNSLNTGQLIVINTDNYATSLGTCDTVKPLVNHVLPFAQHWLHVTLHSGNLIFERRLYLRKGFEVYNVRLEAEYSPSSGGGRLEFESGEANPSEILSYFYNPNLGNFEQRPGGACYAGQNNPTYFKLSLESEKPAQNCNFQASWDAGPVACNAYNLNDLNAGILAVINTETYGINPATCSPFVPLQAHVFSGVNHWMRVTFYINGRAYERRVNFRKQ